MKYLGRILLLMAVLLPAAALADAPSLQVNPLKYQSTLTGTEVRQGYVDVANPTDTTLTIQASVQDFQQYDLAGDLKFFNNNAVQQAITVSMPNFQLGPQQAVRVVFSVDPTKLPQGGTYAAIFFRTIPPAQSSSTSYISESANIGTLLLLQNGPIGAQIGKVSKLSLPFFQFGKGITGSAQYKNTNNTTSPVAFSPKLVLRVVPWGHATKLSGPYVLPDSTRQFNLLQSGSYFGLLPISLVDGVSGVGSTSWVFACTGVYAFLLILLLAFVIIVAAALILKNQPLIPANMKGRKSRKAVAVAAEQSGKIETAIHVDEVDKPNPDIENEVPGDPFDSQVAGIEHGANEAADATKEHSAQDESTREANKDSESNATSLEIKIRRKR